MRRTDPIVVLGRLRRRNARLTPATIFARQRRHVAVAAPVVSGRLTLAINHFADEKDGNSTGSPVSGSEQSRLAENREEEQEALAAFAQAVAYRLQTHLGLLVGFAENVKAAHKKMPPEVLEEQLGLIVQNGRRLSELIDELLTVAGKDRKE